MKKLLFIISIFLIINSNLYADNKPYIVSSNSTTSNAPSANSLAPNNFFNNNTSIVKPRNKIMPNILGVLGMLFN